MTKSFRSKNSQNSTYDKEPPQDTYVEETEIRTVDKLKFKKPHVPDCFVNCDGASGNYAGRSVNMDEMAKKVVASFMKKGSYEDNRKYVYDRIKRKDVSDIIVKNPEQEGGGQYFARMMRERYPEIKRRHPTIEAEKIMGFAMGEEADWIIVEGQNKPIETILKQ